MIDYGTRQTDLAVRRAEWRLSRVYRQAQRDIDEKLKDWQKRHEEREKRYRQQLADGKISQADFDAWMRGQVFQDKQWQARKAEIDRILLNADREAQRIVNEGKIGVFADNANYIGYDLERNGNVNTGFTLYDQNTVGRLIKSDPQILPKPTPGVQKDKAYTYYNKLINSAITQGIVQGETIPQIAKRIVNTTGERSYSSAVRNARTAYTGAQNAGRMEGLHQAQRLGINVKKKWMATLDSRTRDAHADLDGQIQDVDDPFESELGDIMYPGDPTADPANTYNCRCTLVYVYPDYPSEMQRRDNETGEIVGDMTYREWEAMKRGEDEQPEAEKSEPTIAGVERGKPMNHDDADSGNVNPNFGTDPAYGINCQSCVVTYEARRRGYDIEVVPNNAQHPMCDKLARDTRLAYRNKDGTQADYTIGNASWTWKGSWEGETPTAKRFEKMLNDRLDESGRYTVQFKWQGFNAAHIVTLTKDSSGPVIYDPQSNRTFRGKDLSDYLARMQYKRQYKGYTYYQWPSVMRVDDKDFDFDVVNQVTQRRP